MAVWSLKKLNKAKESSISKSLLPKMVSEKKSIMQWTLTGANIKQKPRWTDGDTDTVVLAWLRDELYVRVPVIQYQESAVNPAKDLLLNMKH